MDGTFPPLLGLLRWKEEGPSAAMSTYLSTRNGTLFAAGGKSDPPRELRLS